MGAVMAEEDKSPRIMPLRSGVDYELEEQADAWLAKEKLSAENRDYLSADQLKLRAEREISNSLGVADASLMAGMYRRAHNPLAGTRPGKRGHSHDDG